MAKDLETRDLKTRDGRLGYAVVRVVLGVNLTMHGVSRFLMGPGEFGFKLQTQFAHSPLPAKFVWAFGTMLPGIEALLGVLILFGLRTRAALVGAGMLMAVLTFGVCLIQDFAAAGLQLTYAVVIAGLVALVRYNGWSVDAAMGVRGQVTAPDERVQVPCGDGG